MITIGTLNWSDPIELREALAYLHVAEFTSAYNRRRARQIARRLHNLTGISEQEIYEAACEDAEWIRHNDD